MKVAVRVTDGVVIIDVAGRITLGDGSRELTDRIDRAIDQGHKRILLNLGEVPFVDSAGLGALVRARAVAARYGAELKLLRLTTRISDLLTIAKLLTVFETFETEQEAVESYQIKC